jgi:hypothetical protein
MEDLSVVERTELTDREAAVRTLTAIGASNSPERG